LEEIETEEAPVQERRRPLASGALDERRPVDDVAGERGQPRLRRLVAADSRAQQEQTRCRVGRERRRHGRYDVVLVREAFPIVVRWLVLHVALFTRQHVVVSAPKMLLGSSVGFSYGRFS
jgi:hypothetical protein